MSTVRRGTGYDPERVKMFCDAIFGVAITLLLVELHLPLGPSPAGAWKACKATRETGQAVNHGRLEYPISTDMTSQFGSFFSSIEEYQQFCELAEVNDLQEHKHYVLALWRGILAAGRSGLPILLTTATVAIFWVAHYKVLTVIHTLDRFGLVYHTLFAMSVALMPALTTSLFGSSGGGSSAFGLPSYAFGLAFSSLFLWLIWKDAITKRQTLLTGEQEYNIGRWMRKGVIVYFVVCVAAFTVQPLLVLSNREVFIDLITYLVSVGLFAVQANYVLREGTIDRFVAADLTAGPLTAPDV